MSTQKNEQYLILSPEWLASNPLPDDAEVQVKNLPLNWVGSARQGKLADPRDLPSANYRTQRTDLPPEAYITPPTDTTGSGRDGETPETDRECFPVEVTGPGGAGTDTEYRVDADFARQLERQRDAALAVIRQTALDTADPSDDLETKRRIIHKRCRAAIDSAKRQEGA